MQDRHCSGRASLHCWTLGLSHGVAAPLVMSTWALLPMAADASYLLRFLFLGWIWPTQPTQHHAAKVSGYQNRLWHFSVLDKLNLTPGRRERVEGEEEKKKQVKMKGKRKKKSRRPFLELLGEVTAQPNVCAGRTAAIHPSSV